MNTKTYMLKILKNHRIYESITCRDDAGSRIKYDLLAAEPPVGLLSDIASRETKLTAKEREKAEEMFSVYCMYHGAEILGKNNPDDVLNFKLIQSAMKCAEKCLESGKFGGFHSLFANLVKWRRCDGQRKDCFRVRGRKASANGKNTGIWQSRTTSMEFKDQDSGTAEMKREVENRIAEISLDQAARTENIELVRETLESCRNLGLISREQFDMLCHYYGIGRNYEMMNQTAIARKLGVSPAYVCNKLAHAYEIMRDFIACARPAA